VAHRDLKPENLLFDSKSRSIKIADFGLSNIIDDGELLQTYCGSPNYAAPEIISGQLYSGPEADVWSCGIILYALLTARLPFDDSFLPHLFKKIKAGKYIMPPYLSSEAKDLMSKILVVNPVDRITTDQIWAHPWFRENLPKYLETAADPEEVKQEIVESIVNEVAMKMGVPPNQVTSDIEKSLETGQVGPYFVAYQIVADTQQLSKEYRDPINIVKDKNSLAEISLSPVINLRKEIPLDEDHNPLTITNSPMDQKYPKDPKESPQSFWNLGYLTTQLFSFLGPEKNV
jgi:serine/threonine protein kinase